MATPFKLKSGNTSAFKNLGSSPVKQDLPKDFNVKGSKGSTTPGYSTTKAAKVAKEAKDYTTVRKELGKKISGKNIKVDIPTGKKAVKEYTRVSKTGTPKGFTKQQKVLSNIDKATKGKFNKQIVKAGSSKLANTKLTKQVVKQGIKKGVGRLAGAALGPAATLAGLAYGAYKSGQKHSGGKVGTEKSRAKWQKAKEAPMTTSKSNREINFNKGK